MTEDMTLLPDAVQTYIEQTLLEILIRIAINTAGQMALRDGGDMTEFRAVLARTAGEFTIGGPTFAKLVTDGLIEPDELEALLREKLTETIGTLLAQTQKLVQKHNPSPFGKH